MKKVLVFCFIVRNIADISQYLKKRLLNTLGLNIFFKKISFSIRFSTMLLQFYHALAETISSMHVKERKGKKGGKLMNTYIKPFVLFLLYLFLQTNYSPKCPRFYFIIFAYISYFFTLDRLICEF